MKIPGIVKFILFSSILYAVLTLKPVRRAVLGFLISSAANILKKKLAS